MAENSAVDHLISLDDITVQKFVPSSCNESTVPGPNQILVKLDNFTISANNITYALTGDTLGYWSFFPTPENPGWGRVPIWGFADVVRSSVPGVEAGTRIHGVFPISTYSILDVTLIESTPPALYEISPVRSKSPVLYKRYRIVPAETKDTTQELLEVTLLVNFYSAFLMSETSLAEEKIDGKTVVILSASSKTGSSTASILKKRNPSTRIIGVSSTTENKDFAAATGFYDDVYTYSTPALSETLSSLPNNIVLVDLAGKGQFLTDLKKTLGSKLERIVLVGNTDWKAGSWPPPGLENSEPFMAPDALMELVGAWGEGVFGQKFVEVFTKYLTGGFKGFSISQVRGHDALLAEFQKLLKGGYDPSTGLSLKL